MRPSLQLKISQQLSMTPQLQLAIRLLQLSTLELQQEIQTALENNPLLEIVDQYDEVNIEQIELNENVDTREALDSREIPDDIPLDASLDDIYTAGTPSGTHSDYRNDELPVFQGETHETLYDYLKWQLDLTPFSDIDRAIAVSIIDAIDERGYLTVSLDEILEEQGNDEIELEEVETVLKRIWHFDPIGVGARTLQECLSIQIQYLTPPIFVKQIIDNYLDLLAVRDYRTLKKMLNATDEQLKESIDFIQHLQPYPGDSVNTTPPDYVIPDVVVKKMNGRWIVELNNDTIPNLRINQQYAAMEKIASQSDSQYIKSHLQEANWFIKSIENRNETLLKVSQFIVEHQQEFFEHGAEYMKPMILSDVATAIDMHESTISRVTTQKYLQCPAGIFELKFFFSSHVNTESGGEASSTAIRALIKKYISAEDSKKPLSDSKLVSMLEKQGIIIARRTVAKYREALSIPPSSQRKQL
ncbi:RNA polymerase factor sigma-54 [Gilliamella apicola]|uniref:RNA polymerase factor sigma-54 n=1 Tax=Gilliamella apicola TaxID=1196095 RepID=UPI000A349B93|nr:RNA polymerase factor sigma-54 [Gilliamella apicola]OTP90691.1 RNA polymerase factor sigma-54 [Gilliamella apicola]OTQ12561.1 RNA polymerase factor sigma-54 [Gilliamella apicola]PXZ02420.1 RNA polymerase factor sigma-54 [Gilliamella apicola]WLS92833.1 RNA polymerase factor sigma-54 [Gilliamella apicola]